MPSKVSIVVPIYKVEKYLRRCVDSIINQTYSDLEIICIGRNENNNYYRYLTLSYIKDILLRIKEECINE